jgi:hypothetical protein
LVSLRQLKELLAGKLATMNIEAGLTRSYNGKAARNKIALREKTPLPGGIVTQAITQPFHIVRVAINGTGTVGFRRIS